MTGDRFDKTRRIKTLHRDYGRHEALHTTALVMDFFERNVVQHRSIMRDDQWYTLSLKVIDDLLELYESIAEKHLTEAKGIKTVPAPEGRKTFSVHSPFPNRGKRSP